jgi:hypothetical protein
MLRVLPGQSTTSAARALRLPLPARRPRVGQPHLLLGLIQRVLSTHDIQDDLQCCLGVWGGRGRRGG